VTHALEVIGVIVAVVGLGLALASLMLERRADFGDVAIAGHDAKSRDCTSRRHWKGSAWPARHCVYGHCSPGLWLGWLLVYRINKQCFGWTLAFHLPSGQLLALGAAVVSVGVLVAAMVSRRIVRA
jgi:putative ABC transport system permease protein